MSTNTKLKVLSVKEELKNIYNSIDEMRYIIRESLIKYALSFLKKKLEINSQNKISKNNRHNILEKNILEKNIFYDEKEDKKLLGNPLLNIQLIDSSKISKTFIDIEYNEDMPNNSVNLDDNQRLIIDYAGKIIDVKKIFDVIESLNIPEPSYIQYQKHKLFFNNLVSLYKIKNKCLKLINLVNLYNEKIEKLSENVLNDMSKLEKEHVKIARIVGKELFPMGRKNQSNNTYNNQENTGTNTICDIIEKQKIFHKIYTNLTDKEAREMINNNSQSEISKNNRLNEGLEELVSDFQRDEEAKVKRQIAQEDRARQKVERERQIEERERLKAEKTKIKEKEKAIAIKERERLKTEKAKADQEAKAEKKNKKRWI